ncbi:MAG: ABC transporter ATP-binding protein [bacterium]|nr:MAG: ABC transporter ATP-binding protein [bacterium]
MRKPVIEIENLSLSLANKSILNSVSLQIFEGDYLSIIGSNGAGKTSLLKCIMRIYSDYQGTIWLMRIPLKKISQKSLAKQISYVPQANGRIFPYTVEEFVMMGRYPHLSPFTSFSADDRKAMRDALEITNTDSYANRLMNTLSGGERQTVFIAAALAQGASIMLLDEPTTFLDPKHEMAIYSILKKLNRDLGMTIVSVTHDINNAVLQSDRVIILKNGQIMHAGKAQDIMRNEILEQAFDKSFTFITHPKIDKKIILPDLILW